MQRRRPVVAHGTFFVLRRAAHRHDVDFNRTARSPSKARLMQEVMRENDEEAGRSFVVVCSMLELSRPKN
jgi:hypothetical protein